MLRQACFLACTLPYVVSCTVYEKFFGLFFMKNSAAYAHLIFTRYDLDKKKPTRLSRIVLVKV
jgi:hypothetical protein